MTAATFAPCEALYMTDPPHQDKRRRAHKLTPRETTQALTSGRQQMRDARAYAEQWYQALKAWDWASRGQFVPRDLAPKRSSTRQMTPVVGNWSAGDVMLSSVQVRTPIGWVAESTLARLCNADPLLERVRAGQGPENLLRETGAYVHPVDRTEAYALAVLLLAAHLGDVKALKALQTLKMVE